MSIEFQIKDLLNAFAEIEKLKARIAELEALVRQWTGNTPPGSGGNKPVFKPSKRDKKRKKKLVKKPGKPDGGRKKPDHIDETVEQKLDRCPDCGQSLSDKNIISFWDHLQEDIVPAHIKVTCYRHFRYRCSCCHKIQNSPAQGDEIPHSKLGPRTLLAAVLFKYQYALPYNKIASMLKQTCGLPVTDGALSQGVLRLK